MSDHPTPEETRREGVTALPIRLADGRDWWFSCPTVRLIPRVATELDRTGRTVRRISVEIARGFAPEIQRLVEDTRASSEKGSAREQYEAFFALAAGLLTRAHEIGPEAACGLLSVSEEELPRLVREVMSIALGTERTTEG